MAADMIRVIHKFPVPYGTHGNLRLPASAQVLTVQMQNGVPQLWAVVTADAPPSSHRGIFIIGAGFELPAETGNYIATFQDGPYVWHVFETAP